MPVKRRVQIRRQGDVDAWDAVFSTGYDLLWELQMLGVEMDEYGRPDTAVIEEAWRTMGEAYLEKPRHPELPSPWALEIFGDPRPKRGKRRR
ncbi:hypothetical protein A6U87_17570 [Rhizobium sp. AC44/96]|uniref:hypothetical protein n=1 Tax=Rhizobium sp. AC44/96 TaxID=1841654 RepID=UPI000810057E|nr:hypothetical protein [Rhizobium sp. AC44/96]OCJ03744.1 hypothetical protein A6U87_17570 [Rhizobium sp. AC44/96]